LKITLDKPIPFDKPIGFDAYPYPNPLPTNVAVGFSPQDRYRKTRRGFGLIISDKKTLGSKSVFLKSST
jgi:hypothetical protein